MVEDKNMLNVENLYVSYGEKEIIKNVSFSVKKGEALGITGPSGSGKSVLVRTIMNLDRLESPRIKGDIIFRIDGTNYALPKEAGKLNGRNICMVFQDPISSLHPMKTLDAQLKEVFKRNGERFEAKKAVEILGQDGVDLLDLIKPDKDEVDALDELRGRYPNHLSGGMCQRFMLGMALIAKPDLLIADEPVTDIDRISRKGIVRILKQFKKREDTALIIISHGIDIFQENKFIDRLLLLEDGGIGAEHDLRGADWSFDHAPWPIARLYEAYKELRRDRQSQIDKGAYQTRISILGTTNIKKSFPQNRKNALEKVTMVIEKGIDVGIIGETGSGKTTLANILTGLLKADGGEVFYYPDNANTGKGIREVLKDKDLKKQYRDSIQFAFQESDLALNNSIPLRKTFQRTLRIKEDRRFPEIESFLKKLDLEFEKLDEYPSRLSDGQKRRIFLARNLISFQGNGNKILIMDEALSGLDMPLVLKVIKFLQDIKEKYNLTYVIISHDISIVKKIASYLFVLYKGFLLETGLTDDLFSDPKHPYTRDLIREDQDKGKNSKLPCVYRKYCSRVCSIRERPSLKKIGDFRYVACENS